VNSLQPPVLVKTLLALSTMYKGIPQQGWSDKNKLEIQGKNGLPQEKLREFLDDLVLWTSNKMMNFR
jgi:hypothetical protein